MKDYLALYDKQKIKNLLEDHTVGEVGRIMGVDARQLRRAMRQYGFDPTLEPPGQISLLIKDTPVGRRLASALGLEVNLVYPDKCTRDKYRPGNARTNIHNR